jgi:hypothetical protein
MTNLGFGNDESRMIPRPDIQRPAVMSRGGCNLRRGTAFGMMYS